MGEDRQGRGNSPGCRALSRTARVVPRLATFSVDEGFWYSVPENLADSVVVGSIVRVPLSGRRVRGHVVEVSDASRGALKDVVGVSGDYPVFDERLLETLKWAAAHYVAPLATVLDRAGPPNLPRSSSARVTRDLVSSDLQHPLSSLTRSAVAGKRRPSLAIVTRIEPDRWLEALTPALASGRSAMIVVATAAEAEHLHGLAATRFGDSAVMVSGSVDAELTGAWSKLKSPGLLAIGTPRIALWPITGLAVAVVVEDGRRAMKDRQTPTLHVRDVLTHRARVEGFSLAFIGPTPSLEVISRGAESVRVGNRAWSLVEIVDRRGDAPGSGYLGPTARAALDAVTREGGRSLVFTHRRLGEESMRCMRCRRARTCAICGSRLNRDERCRRCGEPAGDCLQCGGDEFEPMGTIPERLAGTLANVVGRQAVSIASAETPVTVGTERDLAVLPLFDLIVVADADGLLLSHDFRAEEEALRVLARLGNRLHPGSRRRLMIQTSLRDSPVLTAMTSGNPLPFLERTLVERGRQGLPPTGDMLALEVRGEIDPGEVTGSLDFEGVSSVLGPADSGEALRWLIQGSLGEAKQRLRGLVQRWRDLGVTVRVDVDPIDF